MHTVREVAPRHFPDRAILIVYLSSTRHAETDRTPAGTAHIGAEKPLQRATLLESGRKLTSSRRGFEDWLKPRSERRGRLWP